MEPTRLLFVDDEPNIRITLSSILKQHGFAVSVASTVPEALTQINSKKFDVLISDLNIGSPADGFTVVGAMRRTQPDCINLILTGYPAFETALRAIQSQVDDYLVKPTDVESLVANIKSKLVTRKPAHRVGTMQMAAWLRENLGEIQQRVLNGMKADPLLGNLQLSDQQRGDYLPNSLRELAQQLESAKPDELTIAASQAAVRHGRHRQGQGYSIPMLIDEERIVGRAIFDAVQDHILELDLSRLITDLKLAIDICQCQLEESTKGFLEAERSAA